jgi:hypothetical protein
MLWKGLLIFASQAFVAPPSKIAFLNSDKVTQLVLADFGLPAHDTIYLVVFFLSLGKLLINCICFNQHK